ncbi:uncharacterized protein LOC113291845 [Papaver somniferum]|uniref:uncharacterized protein LOC113291845 n=1 Tax=Papaver somniferum TaxID=3469 RepID=UPI000E701314|nr:uncharacterized protein LOC113291845 [Papaver somniferum]
MSNSSKTFDLKEELSNLQATDIYGSNTSKVIELEKQIESLNDIQASSNKQKSRDRFYNDMDKNSKYFHIRANQRRTRNKIDSLKAPDGSWCQDKSSIEQMLVNHFQTISTTGPDGFLPGFYQSQWSVVKDDICKVVQAFFHSGFLLKKLNSTRVTLIPRVNSAQKPEDFRPITLCNTIYKIISKVIALRIKKDMVNIISPMQSAYVPRRLISENICLVQELVQAMKKKKGRTGHLALNMDISKAYDRLEWKFLMNVLKKFGFSEKLCQLIHQCISTTQNEIMVNGSPSPSFKPTRGIRKGDPLSPYLFILAMEPFSRNMNHYEVTKQLTGMKISRSAPKINHLLFADDCLLFCKANLDQTRKLLQLIEDFSSCSGQLINFHKSAIYFSKNMSPSSCQTVSGFLQVRQMNLNEEKYLGLLFFIGRNKKIPFSILNSKMEARLTKWRCFNMSEAARSVMVRGVTNAIPVHHMLSFKLPDSTIKKMNSTQQMFWRRKRVKQGKATDNLEKCECSKRRRRAKYFPDGQVSNIKKGKNTTWSWTSISYEINFILKFSFWSLGNGHKILIWKHNWVHGMHEPPIPKQGAINTSHYTHVYQLMAADNCSWNSDLLFSLFEDQTANVILNINIFPDYEDKLVWTLEKNGGFSVKSAYKKMFQEKNAGQIVSDDMKSVFKRLWRLPLLPRVQQFLWKCVRDVLPSRDKLTHVIDGDYSCSFCKQVTETTSHCILEWHIVHLVLFAVLGVRSPSDVTLKDWIISHFTQFQSGQINEDIICRIAIVAWCIWSHRCDTIFKGVSVSPETIIQNCRKYLSDFTDMCRKKTVNPHRQNRHNLHWSPPPRETIH